MVVWQPCSAGGRSVPGRRHCRMPVQRDEPELGRYDWHQYRVMATAASVIELRKVHSSRDVILNPVCVPPFLRVNLDPIELHREMDVVASGHAGLAAQAHHLALLYHVAFVDIHPAQVAVDRLQSVSMVDDDTVTVDP